MTGFKHEGRTQVTDPSELVSVDTWRDLIVGDQRPLDAIELRGTDALGLVLAQDVLAHEPIPSFANSAMDGYAVRAQDIAGASAEQPVELEVGGEVAAGAETLPTVADGVAVRIMTGAPVPPGADAVVPVETTSEGRGGKAVRFHRVYDRGANIRTVGQDVAPGQELLKAGHRLRAADVGLLAAVGAIRVAVRPAPRVVILSTGDELVSADRRPGAGQIRDANGPMLSALVRQAGALPYSAGIVADDMQSLMYALDSNLGHADLFICTGGASAGAYDHVAEVIGRLGKVRAQKVAVKPGKPQIYGRIGETPVFGLPGNPVSAFTSFELFVRPAIRAMQGRSDVARPQVKATLSEPLTSSPHRRTFARVRLSREQGRWMAAPTGHQGSHLLTSIVSADGLADIPEDVTRLEAGEKVNVHLLVEA